MVATVAFSGEWISRGVHRTVWGSMATGTSGAPQSAPHLPDKTIYIGGTFSTGGTVSIQGSNDSVTMAPSSSSWSILTDAQGDLITKTAEAIETIMENPVKIRPLVTSGDGSTAIDVVMVCAGGQ